MKRLLVPDKVHQKSQFAVEMASCQSQLVVSKQECKKKKGKKLEVSAFVSHCLSNAGLAGRSREKNPGKKALSRSEKCFSFHFLLFWVKCCGASRAKLRLVGN